MQIGSVLWSCGLGRAELRIGGGSLSESNLFSMRGRRKRKLGEGSQQVVLLHL